MQQPFGEGHSRALTVVFYDMLSRADGLCDFAVLEAQRDKFDDALLAFVQDPFSVAVFPIHSCSRTSILGTEGGKALFDFLPPGLPLVVSSSIVVGGRYIHRDKIAGRENVAGNMPAFSRTLRIARPGASS
jgi:hypothetical protein